MNKVLLAVALGLAAAEGWAGNVVATQAEKGGIKKCLPTVKAITNFIVGGDAAGADSFWDDKRPDASAFSAAIETDYDDGTVFTNVVVAPTPNGKCYVEYEKVITYDAPCAAVSKDMSEAKYVDKLNERILMFTEGPASIYLIPNDGESCTMIRKEVIFEGVK